jgi:hypothetical protein
LTWIQINCKIMGRTQTLGIIRILTNYC